MSGLDAGVRVFVHALDRTGPPMLALAFVRWLRRAHADTAVEVVAFRGGPLADEWPTGVSVAVVLDDEEPWDAAQPDDRFGQRVGRLAHLAPVGVNLLVSVAAGQALPLLPPDVGPVVTWSVEIGEDLHWVDAPIGLRERTVCWLAGSEATRQDLQERLGLDHPPGIVPEFVEAVDVAPDDAVARRAAVGVGPEDLLVVGAGIGTVRKGVDLFVEAAVLHHRRRDRPARFVWIGGERDRLVPRVAAEIERLGLDHVTLRPGVRELDPWLAAADIFLHPARADAFPLVCLHAALQGTPVVGFDGVGGLGEMFGPTLISAPYPDLPGLVDQVAALASDDRRRAAGQAQREAIEGRFTAAIAAPVLYDALAECAAGRSA